MYVADSDYRQMESKNEFRELPEVKTEVIDPEFEPVAVKIEIQDDSYDRETSKLYYEAQDQNNTAVEHCKNRTPSPPATIENSQSKETLNGLYANEENSQPTEIAACPDGSEENCQESDRIEKRNLDENIKCERKVLIRRKRKTRPTTDKWRKNSFTAKSRKQVGNELEERTDSDVDDQNEQEDMVDDSIQKVKKKRKNISNKGKASNNARVKKEQNIEQSAECKTCHKVFSRVSSMLRHRRRSKCSQKENPPDDGTAYLKNLEKKLSLQTICTVCNRVLSSPANLKRHFDALHGDGIRGAENYNVVCAFEGCTKRFNLPSSMRKHYDAVHMNIRKYLCDICSDMFKNISALKMHMKACHTKDADMYECSVCKKRFSTKFKLTSHETLHTNIKPFSCDYEGCGKLFR